MAVEVVRILVNLQIAAILVHVCLNSQMMNLYLMMVEMVRKVALPLLGWWVELLEPGQLLPFVQLTTWDGLQQDKPLVLRCSFDSRNSLN